MASSGDTDTTVRLARSDGTVLASDDDGGSGGNFRIEHRVAAAYYVAAGGFNDARAGDYSLEVSFTAATGPVDGDLRPAVGRRSTGPAWGPPYAGTGRRDWEPLRGHPRALP